jgi:metal-responsive CopG/Arc/MetJ family transcriptional regulator
MDVEMSQRKKPPQRAEGQSQISITMPTWMVSEIDAMAKGERRSRSNFIVAEMEKVIDRRMAQKKFQAERAFDAVADRHSSSTASIVHSQIGHGKKAAASRYQEGVEEIKGSLETLPLSAERRGSFKPSTKEQKT